MNYADIKKNDVANGPGIRISIFVSGCTHHCRNCFNEETWDFDYGNTFTEQTLNEIIEYLKEPYISGLSFLGGEPMEPINQEGLLPLARKAKEMYPNKSIWCFTGYRFKEDIMCNMYDKIPGTSELLSYIDVIVDGEYIEDLKNLNLYFKGSSNQKTILVQETLKTGNTVLWKPPIGNMK